MNNHKTAVAWRWSGLAAIGEVMRPGICILRRTDRVVTAMALLRANNVTHAAVVDGQEVEGVVAQQDLDALCWMLRGSTAAWIKELLVEDVMQTPPLVLPSDATIAEACRLLSEGARACIVVVSDGHAVGIVRDSDLHPPPVAPAEALRPPEPLTVLQGGLRR